MIKKYASQTLFDSDKGFSESLKDNKFYKEVTHTISKLYRIKEIDRTKTYDPEELHKIVMANPTGAEVIDKLRQMGVTQDMLLYFELWFFYGIFADEFPESKL